MFALALRAAIVAAFEIAANVPTLYAYASWAEKWVAKIRLIDPEGDQWLGFIIRKRLRPFYPRKRTFIGAIRISAKC